MQPTNENKISFKAQEVYADYDPNDLLIIGFSGKMNNEDVYFMIQDAYDREDEQEIELGMDTYYLEWNDQSQGGYGGISELVVYRNKIHIELNKIGRKNLKIKDEILSIEFDLNDKAFLNLTEKLKLIFEPEEEVNLIFISAPE